MLTFIVIALVVAAVRASTLPSRKDTHHYPHPELPPPEPRVGATLATAREGELVKLVGRVKLVGDPMTSPLTGKRCVACLVRAQVWHSRKIPQLIDDLRDARLVPFVLEVEGGEVVIEGAIVIEMRTAKPATKPAEQLAHALLAAHKLERFLASSDFEEALIQDGDRIAVTGVISRGQEAGGYRDIPIERVRFIAHERLPVTLTTP